MYLLRYLIITLISICSFVLDASIHINVKFTEQGYWYGKVCHNDPLIPDDICYEAWNDLCLIMSPAEVLCFLSETLREDHSALNKLKLWNYVKSSKLQIPQKDVLSIKTDNSILKTQLEANKWIFEKIKKFWGGDKKRRIINLFYYNVLISSKYRPQSSCFQYTNL